MKKGFQQQIANNTGLHKSTISHYFTGASMSRKTLDIIDNYLDSIDMSEYINERKIIPVKKRKQIYRSDILKSLVRNDLTKIGKSSNTQPSYVLAVLSGIGRVNQNTERSKQIIKAAELVAAINNWKTKHCITESLL